LVREWSSPLRQRLFGSTREQTPGSLLADPSTSAKESQKAKPSSVGGWLPRPSEKDLSLYRRQKMRFLGLSTVLSRVPKGNGGG
jgi:hypothetical protein